MFLPSLWHLASGASFISSPLLSDLASPESLLKNTGQKRLRSHWCNTLKQDERGWHQTCYFDDLGGCALCKPASPHERTARKCIWHANSVITMLVRALVLSWFESGNTSFAHRLCGRRHPSYVDDDDTLFCFGVLEKTQTHKQASSPSEANNTRVRRHSVD